MKDPVIQAETLVAIERPDAEASLRSVRDLTISTAADYESVVALTAEAKARSAKVDEVRRSITDPLNLALKRANGLFRPVLDAWAEIERVLKAKLVAFQAAQAAERDRLLAAAGESPGDADGLIAEAEAAIVPVVGGLSTRRAWTGEVSDASLIPREYLVPDVRALMAVTRAAKADPGIPGWRAWPETVAAVKKAP